MKLSLKLRIVHQQKNFKKSFIQYFLNVYYYSPLKTHSYRCSRLQVFSGCSLCSITKTLFFFFLIKSFRLRLKIQRKAYKYIEKRLLHRFFLENFQKFCKAAVLKNISEWLLLIYVQGITFI